MSAESDQRLLRLETAVTDLTATVRDLKARLDGMVGEVGAVQPHTDESREQPAPGVINELPSAPEAISSGLALIGRCCLVFCGAFMLRALTDAGTLPVVAGVVLGLAYACFWLVAAARAAGAGKRLSAEFHGVTATIIAFPLLAEATVRFAVLAPTVAAACLAAFTAVALFAGLRHRLQVSAWATVIAAVATVLVLARFTSQLDLFAPLMVVVAVAALWVAYSGEWLGLRWLPAAGADIMVLHSSLVVCADGGPRAPFAQVSTGAVLAAAVGLLVAYLATFVMRTLRARHTVDLFEVLQTAAVVAVGLGGAVRVAAALDSGAVIIAVITLVLGLGAYAAAFVFVERRSGRGRNFFFYTTVGLILTCVGWAIIAKGAAMAVALSLLGLAAAGLGGRFDRVTLRAHAAVYLVAAAAVSGLAAAAGDALLKSAAQPWRPIPVAGFAALVAVVLGYVTLVALQVGRESSWPARLPRLVVAVTACMGVGATVVVAIVGLLGATEGDAGLVAAVRTAVVAVAALAVAVLGREHELRELRWLVYPLLVAGGAKLMLVDLRDGRPSTLVVAFAFYGAALILAPRLLRRRSTPAR